MKLRALRSTFCAIQIELFPLDKADHLRHAIFRRDGNEHVDMVGHPMPFLDLALAAPRQFVEYVAKALLRHPENRKSAFMRYLGMKTT